MYIVNIWHHVSDYEHWKKLFDGDPLDREGSGVLRYSVERLVGDESMIIGHLEFATLAEAESFAARLQELWSGPASESVSDAGHTITEALEQREYGGEMADRAA